MSQSRTWANPWGNFHGNRSCWGSFSCCSHNLFTSRTLKIHSWKPFVYGKIFARGKIKSGRKSLVKRKEKESRPKEERKSSILSKKEKIFLYADVQISNKEVPVEPKFAKHAVENVASFSLFKCQPWCKNMNNRFEYCNFESCMSIRCLAPQYLFLTLLLSTFAFGNFAQYCVVLLNAPLRDRGEKKTRVCNGLLFLGIG